MRGVLNGCTVLVVGGVAAGATTGAAVAADPRSGDGVFDDQSLCGKVKIRLMLRFLVITPVEAQL